jgi:hypothetical protein
MSASSAGPDLDGNLHERAPEIGLRVLVYSVPERSPRWVALALDRHLEVAAESFEAVKRAFERVLLIEIERALAGGKPLLADRRPAPDHLLAQWERSLPFEQGTPLLSGPDIVHARSLFPELPLPACEVRRLE